MERLLWCEAPAEERLKICTFYAEHVKCKEGQTITVEELDRAWRNAWFDVIKFTFGPNSWMMQ